MYICVYSYLSRPFKNLTNMLYLTELKKCNFDASWNCFVSYRSVLDEYIYQGKNFQKGGPVHEKTRCARIVIWTTEWASPQGQGNVVTDPASLRDEDNATRCILGWINQQSSFIARILIVFLSSTRSQCSVSYKWVKIYQNFGRLAQFTMDLSCHIQNFGRPAGTAALL